MQFEINIKLPSDCSPTNALRIGVRRDNLSIQQNSQSDRHGQRNNIQQIRCHYTFISRIALPLKLINYTTAKC